MLVDAFARFRDRGQLFTRIFRFENRPVRDEADAILEQLDLSTGQSGGSSSWGFAALRGWGAQPVKGVDRRGLQPRRRGLFPVRAGPPGGHGRRVRRSR